MLRVRQQQENDRQWREEQSTGELERRERETEERLHLMQVEMLKRLMNGPVGMAATPTTLRPGKPKLLRTRRRVSIPHDV